MKLGSALGMDVDASPPPQLCIADAAKEHLNNHCDHVRRRCTYMLLVTSQLGVCGNNKRVILPSPQIGCFSQDYCNAAGLILL